MTGTDKPRLVFTTDVNGTTTPDNTFAELARPDGLENRMAESMKLYTTGRRPFAEVLPEMAEMAAGIDRQRVKKYVLGMPLFPGVEKTLDTLTLSGSIDVRAAFSTTGFAGMVALMSKYRHGGRLKAAASDVLAHLLTPGEKTLLIRKIAAEKDKTLVLDDLVESHKPHPGLIFHVGDTLGDFPGLVHAAEKGGVGIAFCPNAQLKKQIAALDRDLRKKIAATTPKPSVGPDYNDVLDIVRDTVWKIARTSF